MSATALWPARFPLYALMEKRATMGRAAFESEFMCNPHDPSLCEWDETLFQHPSLWFDAWPLAPTIKTMACDPSKGRGDKRSDDSAIVMLARDETGVLYCDVDARNDRGAEVITDTVCEWNRVFRPERIGFETNQFQELFLILFRQRATPALPIPIEPLDNRVNKMVRIRRLGSYFTQRLIRFKRGSPGAAKAVQQAKDFRGDSKDHDDILDSLEMAIRVMVALWNNS
jgi:predicted phage terminase large subunit-like protein